MGAKFVNIDRNTPMLLPCDLRDWVKDNDLAAFVLEAVETTDLTGAHVNHRGTGSAEYPPAMMLALLIYCYATGVFSSRKIERATYDSISVRYLCANEHPDHDTIAKFRRRNRGLVEKVFMQVLELAGHMGLLKLGTICIDGTKIHGNADPTKNLTIAQIDEELRHLRVEVKDLLGKADEQDRRDSDADGTLLPEELGQRERRKALLEAAKGKLEERLERLEKSRKESAKRSCRKDRKVTSGRKANPEKEQARRDKDREHQRINPNDPDSYAMPVRKGGFVQGYNAQASVDAEGVGLIVGAHVTNQPTDRQELEPNLNNLNPEHLKEVRFVAADKGYYNRRSMIDLEKAHDLRMVVPPTHQDRKEKQRYAKDHPREIEKRYKEKLMRRLETNQGQSIYQKRNIFSEGTFATIKNAIGFDRFRLKGLEGVRIEWLISAIAHNCRKIIAFS